MTENLYTPDCIRTFTGLYMNVFEPTPDMICHQDIAHALSYQCRFGGHLPTFYSVAEHCLNCCLMMPGGQRNRLTALMHDASEAYLMDIPRPIKEKLSNYKEIEDRLMKIIAEKFGFDWPLPPIVKEIDEMALNLEWDQIMLQKPPVFKSTRIMTWTKKAAKENFIQMFIQYS